MQTQGEPELQDDIDYTVCIKSILIKYIKYNIYDIVFSNFVNYLKLYKI